MADPLSVASGVAGLVSLGLTLCNGLHNYFSAIKDRHSDIETATQSLALLQSHICIIQSSTLKLGHRHALAANGVNAGLRNCETQLKALEEFIQDLNGAENSSGAYRKWQKQKMFVRYPFDQKKMFQLQEHLSRANTTLSSFVQSFNLDVNIGISDDLQVLKRDLHDSDITTHSILRAIASQLHTINLVSQPNNMMGVTTYVTQIGGQATAASNNPGPTQPLYMRNSEAEQDLCRNYSAMKCKCLNLAGKSVYNHHSHSYRMWGGVVVSKQTHQQREHRPGCYLYTSSPKGSSKTTLTCVGLRFIFSRFLSFSFTQDLPAGAYSLPFGLRIYNVVEASPAFNLFKHDVFRTFLGKGMIRRVDYSGLQVKAGMMIQQLRALYESGVASPFDVDVKGNNIAHLCLHAYERELWYEDDVALDDTAVDPLFMLLSFMFDIGVPVTACNFHQGTVLVPVVRGYKCLSALPRLYRLITDRDPGFCSTELAYSCVVPMKMWDADCLERLDVYSKYPDISEAIGFNEVFLAVLQRDKEKLEGILQDTNFDLVRAISQVDLYGRTIMHVAVPWPTGLGLLLQHNPLPNFQNSLQCFAISPLAIALEYSGTRCNASDHFTTCHDCDCALSVRLLLEADCSVTVGEFLSYDLQSCSLQARILFFQHLKNRRERLRDVSIAYLPADIIHCYAITPDSLPDGIAGYLWEELIKRTSALNRAGINLGESLRPHEFPKSRQSIFENPLPTEIANLALQFGFQPRDECGLPPLLSRFKFRTSADELACELEASAAYANWLLQHNLKSTFSSGNVFLTAEHHYGAQVGLKLYDNFMLKVFPLLPLAEFNKLLSKICSSNATSKSLCPCVSEPFHRPLAYLMSVLTWNTNFYHYSETKDQSLSLNTSVIDFIQTVVPDFEAAYLARCAAHMLTMRFLGIRHFPMCGDYWPWEERVGRDPALIEEWLEIVEEDRMLVEQLSNLDLEFEDEFERRNESVTDFLVGYWWGRMEEVKRDMERPLSVDERRGLLDIGVILDDGTNNHFDSGPE